MEASACPRCALALKISVIEPHPTRDRVDVVTYRCPIHGDVWRRVVVKQVEAADTDPDATATCRELERFAWSGAGAPAARPEPGRAQSHWVLGLGLGKCRMDCLDRGGLYGL